MQHGTHNINRINTMLHSFTQENKKQNKNRAQDPRCKTETVSGSLSRCECLRLMDGTELVSSKAEEHLVARARARTGEPSVRTKRPSDQAAKRPVAFPFHFFDFGKGNGKIQSWNQLGHLAKQMKINLKMLLGGTSGGLTSHSRHQLPVACQRKGMHWILR